MKLQTDLTPTEADLLALFLKRLTFDHFLSCTDGAAGGLDASGGDTDQAYEMKAAARKVRDALAARKPQSPPRDYRTTEQRITDREAFTEAERLADKD